MKAKFFERPIASLQIAPFATLGLIIGTLLIAIGGLSAPFGDMMNFGVGMSISAVFFLYTSQMEISTRLAEIITRRIGL